MLHCVGFIKTSAALQPGFVLVKHVCITNPRKSRFVGWSCKRLRAEQFQVSDWIRERLSHPSYAVWRLSLPIVVCIASQVAEDVESFPAGEVIALFVCFVCLQVCLVWLVCIRAVNRGSLHSERQVLKLYTISEVYHTIKVSPFPNSSYTCFKLFSLKFNKVPLWRACQLEYPRTIQVKRRL
jgi:hypothetical protein